MTPLPGPAPFATNITAGPYAAKLGGGLIRDGRTSNGLTVARRVREGRGPVTLSLAPAGEILGVGRIISLLAIFLLLIMFARGAVVRFRRP